MGMLKNSVANDSSDTVAFLKNLCNVFFFLMEMIARQNYILIIMQKRSERIQKGEMRRNPRSLSGKGGKESQISVPVESLPIREKCLMGVFCSSHKNTVVYILLLIRNSPQAE